MSAVKSGVDVEEALPPVADTVVAAIRAAPFHLEPVRDELHLGVTEREECVEVAPVEGVKPLVEEPDVLLRHRPRSMAVGRGRAALIHPTGQRVFGALLPQPGGFESVVASRKRPTADDLPVADREDRVKWPIDLGSAAPSARGHPSQGENLIGVVDEPLGLEPQLLPVPGHAFEIPLDLGVTSTGDRAWQVRVFDPFDLWVKERKQPVEVTTAGAGKRRLHYLDVLPRHPPLSITSPAQYHATGVALFG